MRAILYIAGKDLMLRWRDRLGFFWWMVGFPLLIAVFIGTLFAGAMEGPLRAMKVAIVDEANSVDSREYATMLERTGGVAITLMSREEARQAVRQGRHRAFVLLRPSFRLSPAVFLGRRLPIAVGMDPAHQAESAYLQAVLNQAGIAFLRLRWEDASRRKQVIEAWLADMGRSLPLTILESKAIDAAMATIDRYFYPSPASAPAETATGAARMINVEMVPVDEARLRPRSSFEICFPLGMIWGLLGLAAEFAMAIVVEREAGTLLRLRVAPISRLQILAGNGLACFTACVGVMVLLLAVGAAAFGLRLQNPVGLGMAVASTALCFVGITMLLSVLGGTEAAVGGAAWACLLIMAMVGGGMVPTIFMPAWMDKAGIFSPVRWAILSLEGGIWRDFTVREMLLPCAVLLGQGAVCAVAGITILTRSEK